MAGRILRVRDYGGVLFAHLRDWSGEMQVLLDNSRLEQGRAADFNAAIDLGDLVETTGHMGYSKQGHPIADRRALAVDRQVPAPAAQQVEGAAPTRRPGCGPATSTWPSTPSRAT